MDGLEIGRKRALYRASHGPANFGAEGWLSGGMWSFLEGIQ
jgi:hypothetical protein